MTGRVAGQVALMTGAARGQVADTVLFLASDESKFITAHEIAPDAGVTEF